jgi:hypothetical protein
MFWPELLFQYTYTIFVTILYLIDKDDICVEMD